MAKVTRTESGRETRCCTVILGAEDLGSRRDTAYGGDAGRRWSSWQQGGRLQSRRARGPGRRVSYEAGHDGQKVSRQRGTEPNRTQETETDDLLGLGGSRPGFVQLLRSSLWVTGGGVLIT